LFFFSAASARWRTSCDEELADLRESTCFVRSATRELSADACDSICLSLFSSSEICESFFSICSRKSRILESFSRNDLFCFDPATKEWSKVNVNGSSPVAREGHVAVAFNQFLVICGGKNDDGLFNDICLFNTETNSWSRVCAAGGPKSLYGHAATMVGHLLWVICADTPEAFWIDLSKADQGACDGSAAPVQDAAPVADEPDPTPPPKK
jgi:N-acetylneuraminic acid mutarotase